MESAVVAKIRTEWVSASDEYLKSKVSGLRRFEPEQLNQLREALVVLVQVTPELGIFEAKRLQASVDASVLRLNRSNATMAEWLQEAVLHHVYAVVKIRDKQRRRAPVISRPRAPLDIPEPRVRLDTVDDQRPTLRAPSPDPRELSPSMEAEADDFEDGIDDIIVDDEPPIVIDGD